MPLFANCLVDGELGREVERRGLEGGFGMESRRVIVLYTITRQPGSAVKVGMR